MATATKISQEYFRVQLDLSQEEVMALYNLFYYNLDLTKHTKQLANLQEVYSAIKHAVGFMGPGVRNFQLTNIGLSRDKAIITSVSPL